MNAFSFITEPKTLLGDRSPQTSATLKHGDSDGDKGAISAAAAQHGLDGGGTGYLDYIKNYIKPDIQQGGGLALRQGLGRSLC